MAQGWNTVRAKGSRKMSEHPAKENEARELSEDEVAQLVQFFQMLDDWDRQSVSPVPEPPDRTNH